MNVFCTNTNELPAFGITTMGSGSPESVVELLQPTN